MIDALPQPQRKAFTRGISSETIDKLTKKPETSAPSTSKCFQRSQSGNCYFYWMLNLLIPHNYTSSACEYFGQTYNPIIHICILFFQLIVNYLNFLHRDLYHTSFQKKIKITERPNLQKLQWKIGKKKNQWSQARWVKKAFKSAI